MYNESRQFKYSTKGLLVIIIVISFGIVIHLTPPKSPSSEQWNKFGPRLQSSLLPPSYKIQKIPVVIKFNKILNSGDLTVLEEQGAEFRKVGATVLHNNRIYTVKLPYPLLSDLPFLGMVERIEYGGRQLHPQIDDTAAHVKAHIAQTLYQGNLTGAGVTIGIIDTGINWKHPDFYFSDGPTAPVRFGSDDDWFYADLNRDGGFQSGEDLEFLDEHFDGVDTTYTFQTDWLYQDRNGNNKYDYGSETWFLLQDLDGSEAISEGDQVVGLGTSKIRMLWDQVDGDRLYVRGDNLTIPSINRVTDPDQHGTHVAGIATGGQPGFARRFVGIAPKAELLIVRTDYEEANVIAGIQWLVKQNANVILMSLGGTTGYYLDGSSLLEHSIDEAGIPVVVSAGNEGSFKRHAYEFVEGGFQKQKSLKFDVIAPSSGTLSKVFVSVLWRNPDNEMRVYLTPPSASRVLLDLKQQSKKVGQNSVNYERSKSPRGTVLFDIEITGGTIKTGTWILTVENQLEDENAHQYFHCWLETEDVSPTKFQKYGTDQYTITNPATADMAISVVSYDHVTGELSYFSSRGPRIDEVLKPTLAAPGENVTSTTAESWSHSDFTGVSAAAPHVAGAIALMLQADPTASREQILARLKHGTLTDSHTEGWRPTPNPKWGWGKLNVLDSVLLPVPIITNVTLGAQILQNSSYHEVYHGTYNLTFSIQDATYFPENITTHFQVIEIVGNEMNLPIVYNVTQTGNKWGVPFICQVNALYMLNLTVNDPRFSSSFVVNITGIEIPPKTSLETSETLSTNILSELIFPTSNPVQHSLLNHWICIGLGAGGGIVIPLITRWIQQRPIKVKGEDE